MARNHINELHARILRKFHTLCTLTAKSPDQKRAMVEGCGVESSSEISTHELLQLCGALQKELDGNRSHEMDALRKRCLKCLCTYIDTRALSCDNKLGYAKRIACRATGRDRFNQLTATELRGVIGGFNHERKAFEGAGRQAQIDALLAAQGIGGFGPLGKA